MRVDHLTGYASLAEQSVYGLGDAGLAIIDKLASPNGAVFSFRVVVSVVRVGGAWRVMTLPLTLWGGIGQSGLLYAVNVN